MAFNPYSRRPTERIPVSRTFTDDADTFTLTFIRPGQIEKCAALDNANELIKRYLGNDNTPGIGWPPIGGATRRITQTTVHNAALYESMQPADAAERYSAEEFVAMQVVLSDECWEQVAAFGAEVMRTKDPSRPGADTAISSGSVCDTPSDTLN